MTFVLLGTALIGGLVLAYLTRTFHRRVKISSARFFQETPSARPISPRIQLTQLLFSRSFWLQLLALSLLLLALILFNQEIASEELDTIGLAVVLDTSASMSTIENGSTRMMLAQAEAQELVNHLQTLNHALCIRFSKFDTVLYDEQDISDPTSLLAAIAATEVRPLATNIPVIKNLLTPDTDADCPITHLVVLTDMPVPQTEWAQESDSVVLIWRDVANAVSSVGIEDAVRVGQGLLGWDGEIEVEIVGNGDALPPIGLTIIDPFGIDILVDTLTWDSPGIQRIRFIATLPGEYIVQLDGDTVYTFDDEVVLDVGDRESIVVDWQLADRSWFSLLRWQQDTENPMLRVLPYPDDPSQLSDLVVDDAPILFVGDAYLKNSEQYEIDFFQEVSPLLDDLNFDVAEQLSIQGIAENPFLHPVMSDVTDNIWIGASESPLMAYVPGLPLGTEIADMFAEEDLRDIRFFSTTLFFNAARWLLRERELPQLYTLQQPETLDALDVRYATIYPDEGNTARQPASLGDVTDIQGVRPVSRDNPIWPIFLVLMAFTILIERTLNVFGGQRWN